MTEANRTLMRFQWKSHKLLWNLSAGRLGRRVAGLPVLELVTVGHRSGRKRQILINYVEDRGAPALIGTNAGRDVDPAWVKNLRANPQARARWDGNWHDVNAVELTGEDRLRVWRDGVAANPGYDAYAGMLTRPIPIIRLEPLA